MRGMPGGEQVAARVVALAAGGLRPSGSLEDGLVLRRQRRLLAGLAVQRGEPCRTPLADQSGYFDSSNACALGAASAQNGSRPTVQIVLRMSHGRPHFFALLEIAQIRRRLVLLGRHQVAVRAQEIVVLADARRGCCSRRSSSSRQIRCGLLAEVALGHRPGARQRIVDDRDLVRAGRSDWSCRGDAFLDDASRCPGAAAGRWLS